MKNNLLWGAVILVVVIVGAILFGSGGTSPQTITTNTQTPAETTKTAVTMNSSVKTTKSVAPVVGMKTSLGGIFDAKGSYECDYDSITPSTRTSNIVYVSDGKMRGEFRTLDASLSKSTLVVYDGSYLYVWTEGQATGKVSQPKTLADLPGIIPQDVSSGKILGSGLNSVSWICHAWSKDASKLVKPSYVTFN